MLDTVNRRFLFLQGPHGPFFHMLAKMLRTAGGEVWRVGFNAGDRAFWFGADGYIAYRDTLDAWPAYCEALINEHNITDIVLYGDTRPVHAEAVKIAKAAGLKIHVFEEGYMRPYWVTYERGGANGHSRLMDLDVPDMQKVTCLGTPFYAGWGLTDDREMPIERRIALPSLGQLAHAVLIDYPRYFDPKTGLPCPVELVVDRLATGDIPKAGRLNRMTAKLQGIFASYAHLWR